MKSILVFKNDLRLRDNPALVEASRHGEVIAVYIYDPEESWALGGACKVWLQESLKQLSAQVQEKGGKLHLFRGQASEILSRLSQKHKATIFFNAPSSDALAERLREKKVPHQAVNGNLLTEPGTILNATGSPYKVFTPYWKALQKHCRVIDEPLKIPKKLKFVSLREGCSLDEFSLLSGRSWETKMLEYWTPGEKGARQKLSKLKQDFLKSYLQARDIPSVEGTSKLSPHLRFGEVTPRQIWHAISEEKSRHGFLRQVAWREFANHLLTVFPKTPTSPLNPQFNKFPWKKNAKFLERWQKGQTGYPIVDAGMRELWETGWMHNRVRMIVASFLVKHLMVSWVHGAQWFWDTLVDADLANNTMGWQWVAGCGADAAPFFRIFNPTSQAMKFDSEAKYIRRWVPELSELPTKNIFTPWEVSRDQLKAAGIELGKTYPKPIVDHNEARSRALSSYQKVVSTFRKSH